MTSKPVFVLVHGANLGGWCWDRVRGLLEASGYRVLTPTLAVDGVPTLKSYVAQVATLIEGEDLTNVVLAGHSFAGMVITGVADRAKERLRRLVYLDACVPTTGDDFASAIPGLSNEDAEEKRALFRSLSSDGTWLPPPPLELVGMTDPVDRDWVQKRVQPHLLSTWLEGIELPNGGHAGVPKTYVLATKPPTHIMGYPRHAEVARGGGEWTYREISCGHALMIAAPRETAELLMEAAA